MGKIQIGTSRGPAVFTRAQSINGGTKRDGLSPKQTQNQLKKADVVVVEIKKKIIIKEGICATAILAKVQANEYRHKLHWPEIKDGKIVRKNGYDPNCIAVISNTKGKLLLKKGDAAEKVFAGDLPKNYHVEFIPPPKLKELERLKKTQKLV